MPAEIFFSKNEHGMFDAYKRMIESRYLHIQGNIMGITEKFSDTQQIMHKDIILKIFSSAKVFRIDDDIFELLKLTDVKEKLEIHSPFPNIFIDKIFVIENLIFFGFIFGETISPKGNMQKIVCSFGIDTKEKEIFIL